MGLDEIKELVQESVVKVLTQKRDKFVRLGDSIVFRDEGNKFIKEAKASGDESAIKLALTFTLRGDDIVVTTVILDQDFTVVFTEESTRYKEIRELFNSI